jgi:hypothetical protein
MSDSPVRLAIRTEGAWINVYFAKSSTMDGAILVATLRATIAEMPGAHEVFLAFVQKVARVIVEDSLGEGACTGIDLQVAPEHERSGHG